MKTNSQIRKEALSLMKGNWGTGICILLIILVLSYVYSSLTNILSIVFAAAFITSPLILLTVDLLLILISGIFILGPFNLGIAIAYLHLVRDTQKFTVVSIFSAFSAKYYLKSVGLQFLTVIYTLLWTLLLYVPGIIKVISYTFAPYILADNPELTANEAIEQSMKMTYGHKMNLFLIGLGMFGLMLLSALLLFIPLLWITPYYQAVIAKYYEEVKCNNETSCQ